MVHFDWIKRHAERTPDKLAIGGCAHRPAADAMPSSTAAPAGWPAFLSTRWDCKAGDRVSILAQNCAEYFEALFACGKTGVILNTLNWRLAAPELAYILNDCTPRVLIYEPAFAAAVDALRPSIGVEHLIVLGDAAPPGAWRYEDALATGDPAGVPLPRLTYDDTWAILYTSGTTGQPKGAEVTYGNFFYNAVGMGQAIDLASSDVNINVLPTFHAGGLGLYACPTFHAGGTLVLMRAFEPAQLLRLIQEWRVTVLLLVPSIYLVLAQFPDFDRMT